MREFAADLRQTVARAEPLLAALGDERSRRHPAPGKWSPREVIGHLIDSASNNHQRFVRAQLHDDLIFPGYDQAAWVWIQRYMDAPWDDLIALWSGFNRHIARVMDTAPDDDLTRPRVRHNLDELAWVPVPADQPATLEYFMRDYVAHLRHHLRQILDVTEHPWLA
jgi:broad specificity phosphatase PhoE